jgi:hypothetical protein
MRFACLGSMVLLLPLAAQELKLPASFDKLAEKASEVVDVTMDSSMLQLASRFLSDKDPDEARVKKLVSGLKGLYVKSFEFDRRGEYEDSDVESVRIQLRAPGWSRVVGVRSKKDGENVELFLKTDQGQISGLAILATEPRELTIVNIVGSINPEQIRDLAGHFGVPSIDLSFPATRKSGKEDRQ